MEGVVLGNNAVLTMDLINPDSFDISICEDLQKSQIELLKLEDSIDVIKQIKGDCDKLDYALSASIGALCGIIDIFLVGKPKKSLLGNITDSWYEDKIKKFAKINGWKNWETGDVKSAILSLENKFKVPYDQTYVGDATKNVFNLNTKNHHFKSLAHNPTLLGLFFSILNQFTNTSSFVSDGQFFELDNQGLFELKGHSFIEKIYYGFANWIGHLLSDVSGSSNSKGRGMGIPSPIMSWTNDLIVIREKLNLPKGKFLNYINELSCKIYQEGYDVRFETATMIPVFINETCVRLVYLIRRLVKYFSENKDFSLEKMWKECKPFGNNDLKRMLTVSHGTFCLLDTTDALINAFVSGAGTFNVTEFILRFNISGLGMFAISLFGECKIIFDAINNSRVASKEKVIIDNYIKGLRELAGIYNDKELLNFIKEFKQSDCYIKYFETSVLLARQRNVSEEDIKKTKKDIDFYFK